MHKATRSGGYLNASQLGRGKTAMTVQYILETGAEVVLLIVPLGTRIGWERHLKMMGWEHPIHRIESKNDHFDLLADGKPGAYIIGREYFTLSGTSAKNREVRYNWRKVADKIDVAVFDEVHQLQNRKSKAFEHIRTFHPKMKVGLSGTPSGNKFQGFWAVCKWLWPDEIPNSYWNWAPVWAKVVYDPYTYQRVEDERDPGAFVKSLSGYGRLEANLTTELHNNELLVELSPKQRRLYDQMERSAVAWLEENPLVAELPITQRIRLRQITLGVPTIVEDDVVDFSPNCKSSKLDALQEFIKDNPDEPLLILLDSAKFAKITATRLGKDARAWTGDTTHQDREQMLKDFGHEFKYLVATIPAIAEGVDGLQHVCNHVVWLSRSENSILNEQAAGRLHRTGQTKPVHSIDILAAGTYDEGVLSKTLQQALARNASAAKELEVQE